MGVPDQSAPLPIRFRKAPEPSVAPFSPADMKAIKRLSTQLASNPTSAPTAPIASSVDSGLMSDLNVTRLNAEQDVLKARLQFAKAEVTKVQAEKAAVDAKLVYAQTELQATQSLLASYKEMA